MPAIVNQDLQNRKRKRLHVDAAQISSDIEENAKQITTGRVAKRQSATSQILLLEEEIKNSQRHLNNVQSLLAIAKKEYKLSQHEAPAILALCRIFCRFLAEGRLSKASATSPNEVKILEWLKERYADYQRLLLLSIESNDFTLQTIALHTGMQLVREEVINAGSSSDSVWRTALFSKILGAVMKCKSAEAICGEYTEKYSNSFDDIRHYTFMVIAQNVAESKGTEKLPLLLDNSLTLVSAMDPFDGSIKQLRNVFVPVTKGKRIQELSVSAHRKQGQKAWLALLSAGLEKEQRKDILRNLTHNVVPWFQNVELLMDFLTDSYNVGGATSLLSLSGLFYLIQEKNLDYPDFFKKLYSLLDSDLLYSKHRSRFFRLLETFMSSTHLPAVLVASFIKRLSRLALDAPPAAIVAVIPWTYNLLRSHPTTTFMIHRVPRTAEAIQKLEEEGMEDPFDMEEEDPMETKAIDSCLWEIVTLQSHYHPNVASLARILSEQFTKTSYNFEDFLDHSYNSLVESELAKDLKKTPVVEYDIPKKIFTLSSGDDTLERLIGSVIETQ